MTLNSIIRVENIDPLIEESEIIDFFQYCGQIESIKLVNSESEDGTKVAEIVFAKDQAAETALLLQDAELGTKRIIVTSANTIGDFDDSELLAQEQKPKTYIAAEILSHGYQLTENTINEAIKFDAQHGLSEKFSTIYNNAKQNVQSIDQRLAITEHVSPYLQYGATALGNFYDSIIHTPVGEHAKEYIDTGFSKVNEVYQEAKRLAELRKQHNAHKIPADNSNITNDLRNSITH